VDTEVYSQRTPPPAQLDAYTIDSPNWTRQANEAAVRVGNQCEHQRPDHETQMAHPV